MNTSPKEPDNVTKVSKQPENSPATHSDVLNDYLRKPGMTEPELMQVYNTKVDSTPQQLSSVHSSVQRSCSSNQSLKSQVLKNMNFTDDQIQQLVAQPYSERPEESASEKRVNELIKSQNIPNIQEPYESIIRRYTERPEPAAQTFDNQQSAVPPVLASTMQTYDPRHLVGDELDELTRSQSNMRGSSVHLDVPGIQNQFVP